MHLAYHILSRGLNTRIRALFEAGMDIEAVNEYGQSALFLAAANQQSHTLALLDSMGADRGARDNAGVAVVFSSVRDREDSHGVNGMVAASSSCLRNNVTMSGSETATPSGSQTELACDSGIRSGSRFPVEGFGHRDMDRDKDSPLGPVATEACPEQRDSDSDRGANSRVSYILRSPDYLLHRGNRKYDDDGDDDSECAVARINLMSLSISQSWLQSRSRVPCTSGPGARRAVVTRLIPADSPHAGASSLYIDHAFSEHFMVQLEGLLSMLPTAAPERGATECASRSYFCDATGWVVSGIADALRSLQSSPALNGQALRGIKGADSDAVGQTFTQFFQDSGTREGEAEGDSTCSNDSENDSDSDPRYDFDAELQESDAPRTRESSSSRRYRTPVRGALAHMRFLTYSHAGSCSPPHTDLSRRTQDGKCSTHTFLLYLTDCESGGETRLLRSVNPKSRAVDALSDGRGSGRREDVEDVSGAVSPVAISATDSASAASNVLATIRPRRGRMLIFPHSCPHEGRAADSLPKILLRGEML
jgi:2OG-Fe(II) oxygenase superfamily